jgi:hypothetical protein
MGDANGDGHLDFADVDPMLDIVLSANPSEEETQRRFLGTPSRTRPTWKGLTNRPFTLLGRSGRYSANLTIRATR